MTWIPSQVALNQVILEAGSTAEIDGEIIDFLTTHDQHALSYALGRGDSSSWVFTISWLGKFNENDLFFFPLGSYTSTPADPNGVSGVLTSDLPVRFHQVIVTVATTDSEGGCVISASVTSKEPGI